MQRFWVSWYGGSDGDCRPNYIAGQPPAFSWWCAGLRNEEPEWCICAVIDAEDETAAYELARQYWPELVERFCEARDASWTPEPSRFPPPGKP